MVENSAKDHHELFYYDDPQPTSESLNETPFDSSRFELVQSPDPATNFETNNSNFDHFFDQLKFGLSEKHTKFEKNLPHGFDKSADLLSKRQNHEEDFFKLCVLLRKSDL